MKKLLVSTLLAFSLSSSLLFGGIVEELTPNIKKITTEKELQNFVTEHPKAIIEFYNPGCPVCQAFAQLKIFPTVAERLPTIGFAMVSVNGGAALHQKYDIPGYPTFILFVNGQYIPIKTVRNGRNEEVGKYSGYVSPAVAFESDMQGRFAKLEEHQKGNASAPTRATE